MKLTENLKSYFTKKDNGTMVLEAPEGLCPNCWGNQEWDGQFYKFIKGGEPNPSLEVYNNFVQEVARKLDKITLKKDSLVCETCQIAQN